MDIHFSDEDISRLRKHLDCQVVSFHNYINHYEVAHLLVKCLNELDNKQNNIDKLLDERDTE